MKSRDMIRDALLAILGGVAAIWFITARQTERPAAQATKHVSRSVPDPTTPSPMLDTFMAQVITAASIEDPVERCLRTPDPPGAHWHADGVAAYCRARHDDTLTSTRFRDMILHGQGAEVDSLFADYLASQLHDPAMRARFDAAVTKAGFTISTPQMRASIDVWKRQRPTSVFAVVASAIQYNAAAFAARGASAAEETSQAQFTAAHEQANLAHAELERATGMDPSIPMIYSTMLNLGMLMGDRSYAEDAVRRGLAVQSDNVLLRLQQAAMMGPKWGGSEKAIRQVEADALRDAPESPLLWVAAGRAHIKAVTDEELEPPADGNFIGVATEVAPGNDFNALADLARRAGKYDEAVILSVEALRFDDSQPRALYTIGWLGSRGWYREWAKTTLQRAAANNPESGPVASYAGAWLRHLGDPVSAERLLLYAKEHDPDNDWALSTLGDFYSHEGKSYPKAEAIAEELIRRDPDNANGYVIQACVQMDTNHPDRFTTLHAFLNRFGNDPSQQNPANQMRAYLATHKEGNDS